MNQDALHFILQILAVFLGGSSVQLIVVLIRRRAELRQLNTSADVNVATVSDKLIDQLQEDSAVYREQVKDLHAKVQRLEDKHLQSERSFAEQLRDAHAENVRMVTRVAQLQTDLDVATRQITELRGHL